MGKSHIKLLKRSVGVSALVVMIAGRLALLQSANSTEGGAVPKFTYDGSWPKLPLPNKWTFEGITGLAVDKDDVIWVLNRPGDFDIDPIFHVPEKTENYASLNPPTALCCLRPEGILAFDMQGNLIHHWNQADKVDGHLILTDQAGNIWVGSDTMRKYTKDGKLLGAIERVPSTTNPKPGKFVREFTVAPETLDRGSTGGMALSPDQKLLYVSDIMNNVVWIVNRSDGKTIGHFGFAGHSGGGFHWIHMVATDSRGNVY